MADLARWSVTAVASTLAVSCVTSRFVHLQESYSPSPRAAAPELFVAEFPKRAVYGVGWVEVFHHNGSELPAINAEALTRGREVGCEVLVDEALLRERREWKVLVTDDPNGDADVNRRRFLCAFYDPALDAPLAVEVDRDALNGFVKARRLEIVACYEKELARSPTLRGRVVVRFSISTGGRATQVEVEENTLGNDAVAACIVTMIRAWEFPFRPELEVPVAFPFVFSPQLPGGVAAPPPPPPL